MDAPFIFIVFALLLPVTIIALFVCAVRLRQERKKTSIFYGISKGLEEDSWRRRNGVEARNGMSRESGCSSPDIAEGLAECCGMTRSLLRKGLDDPEFLALAERLQSLSEEVEHLKTIHHETHTI
ncbi:unknown [Alistipes sp. CAG:831]|nr:unknown [Alistipes sp. CAG:831]